AYKTLTYPIGNADGFFPAQLRGVNEASTILEIECVKDPLQQISPSSVSEDIDAVFNSRYWTLAVVNGTYSGSQIAISLEGTDAFLNNEGPVVLERTAGILKDLKNGEQTADFVASKEKTGTAGGTYALASTKKV